MYLTYDGYELTAETIRVAYLAGRARLVHSPGINTSLAVDGRDLDNRRDDALSVWDQVWTTVPDSVQSCLEAAYTGQPDGAVYLSVRF